MSLIGTNRRFSFGNLLCIFLLLGPFGCSVNHADLKRAQNRPSERARLNRPAEMDFTKPPDIGALARGEVKPPTIDEASEELERQGGNWLYGKGFGSTTLNIATCIVFPPYILYLLGNAGLEMAGYEPLYITEAVPEPAKGGLNEVYDQVVSIPGIIAAETAGEEFRNK